MTHRAKVILGFASFWPLAWTILSFLIGLGYLLLTMFAREWVSPTVLRVEIFAFVAMQILTILGTVTLMTIFFVHILKSSELDSLTKLAWSGAILLASWVTLPLYWFLHVWPEPEGCIEGGEVRNRKPVD